MLKATKPMLKHVPQRVLKLNFAEKERYVNQSEDIAYEPFNTRYEGIEFVSGKSKK